MSTSALQGEAEHAWNTLPHATRTVLREVCAGLVIATGGRDDDAGHLWSSLGSIAQHLAAGATPDAQQGGEQAALLDALAESREQSRYRIARRGSRTAQQTAESVGEEIAALRAGAAALRSAHQGKGDGECAACGRPSYLHTDGQCDFKPGSSWTPPAPPAALHGERERALREGIAELAGDIYVNGLQMAGYEGPLTGWNETWPEGDRGWVYERVDYLLDTAASPPSPTGTSSTDAE